jgi:hypothetical protein
MSLLGRVRQRERAEVDGALGRSGQPVRVRVLVLTDPPFLFYVSFLNTLIESPLYLRLPSLLPALLVYLLVLVLAYFAITYRAFRVSETHRGLRL